MLQGYFCRGVSMMKRITATLVFVLIGLSSLSVYAEDFASSIVFSQKELDAAFTLTRPEIGRAHV